MNSALQCLSHCEELTKFFLLKKYEEEINKINKYGSGGSIAKAYYELLEQLWFGNSNYLSPFDFRKIFVEFVKQFAGFTQHDSHEMLAFMLDALHEDLNRVKDKPYFELNEKGLNETEEEAAARWWKSHLSRENSIIVDLFHGQFRSKITCPICNKISITYDPFMYLGLPIPAGLLKVKLKFFPLSMVYDFTIFEISVNEHITFQDVKNTIKTQYPDVSYLEGILTQNKKYKRRLPENIPILQFYDHQNYEVVVYETELNVDSKDTITFYIHPFELVEESTYLFMKSKVQQPIFYVKPFTFSRNMTVKELYLFVFKYYRKVFKDFPSEGITYDVFLQNIRDYSFTQNAMAEYFNKVEPFKFTIMNNIPKDHVCEFCGRNCETCAFGFDANTPLENLIQRQTIKRSFLLQMELLTYNGTRLFDNLDIKESGKNLMTKISQVNIYDCLESFKTEEKLEKENAWYCSQCKEHQEALKKLDIYKPPNVLIIQLKRFKIKTTNVVMGFLHNKKNDQLIEFPIDDLDISKFIVSESDRKDARYELFGVSQHFGSLSSGHYTAFCRNRGNWYTFDDAHVSKGTKDQAVSSAAYLLFYRRKTLNK
jgi:ubiquitin C-terminal hydrolase